MNYRTTLVLFAVAAALGIVLFVVESKVPPTEINPSHTVIRDLKDDEIKSIEIAAADRALLLEKRTEGAEPWWEIVKPSRARADRQVVTSLLSDIRWLSARGFVPEAEAQAKGLANYGLDKPSATLTCTAPERTVRLVFGAASPAKEDEVFVRAEGVPGVHVVEKRILDTLTKPAEEFQDRTVFAYDSWKVEKLALTIGGEEVELAKKGADWHIEKPEEIREKAEYAPVNTLLDELKKIRWKDWVEEKPADLDKYGLKTPVSRFAATVSDPQKTETLLVGTSPKDKTDRVYVRRGDDGPVVTVEPSALEKLPKKAEEFRSRKLFDVSADTLQKIEIKTGGAECLVERAKDAGDWIVVQPPGQKVDREQVTDLVTTLNGIQVKEFYERRMADPKTYGFDQPRAMLGLTAKTQVTTTTGEGDKKETKTEDKLEPRAWVFGMSGERVFAKREDQGQVVEIEPKLLKQLQLGALNFKSKALVKTEPGNLQAVTLERIERGRAEYTKVHCVRESGQWKLKAPEGKEADPQRVNDVVSALHDLRAQSWAEGAGDPAARGLDRPMVKVDFTWTETREVRKPAPPKEEKKEETKPEEKKPDGEKKDEAKPEEKKEEKKDDLVEKVTETFQKVLRIGVPTKAKDGHYAQIEGDPAVFILGSSAVERLDQDLLKVE